MTSRAAKPEGLYDIGWDDENIITAGGIGITDAMDVTEDITLPNFYFFDAEKFFHISVLSEFFAIPKGFLFPTPFSFIISQIQE
jgi:hypothetical protein